MRAEIIRAYNRRATKFHDPPIWVPPLGGDFQPDMDTIRCERARGYQWSAFRFGVGSLGSRAVRTGVPSTVSARDGRLFRISGARPLGFTLRRPTLSNPTLWRTRCDRLPDCQSMRAHLEAIGGCTSRTPYARLGRHWPDNLRQWPALGSLHEDELAAYQCWALVCQLARALSAGSLVSQASAVPWLHF